MTHPDFEELLAVLDLNRVDDNLFTGSHPSKNPVRTFGGQMTAQAFVAAGRTLEHKLAPSALNAHFIAGGDPQKDLEFHVVRLRDERRFANRRVDVVQDGNLLTTVMLSYMNAGRGWSTACRPRRFRIRTRCPRSMNFSADTRKRCRCSSRRCARSNGGTPTIRPG